MEDEAIMMADRLDQRIGVELLESVDNGAAMLPKNPDSNPGLVDSEYRQEDFLCG